MRKLTRPLIALALSLAMGAAFAQTTPTMTFQGDVMVSTSGGEFVSAVNGQTVAAGQTIMVPPGGSATLRYSDGTVATFGPGTHVVPASGVVVSTAVAADAATTAAIVGGVVVASAAIIDQVILDDDDDDSPDAPVSP